MTTIAFCRGILAADGQITRMDDPKKVSPGDYTQSLRTQKIFKVPGGWISLAGSYDTAWEYIDYLNGWGKIPTGYKELEGLGYINKKPFHLYNGRRYPIKRAIAIGSGAAIAMEVLKADSGSAKRAVIAAMCGDRHTGGVVQYVNVLAVRPRLKYLDIYSKKTILVP